MPHPLKSAGPDERHLLDALPRNPLDPHLPLAAADEAEERGDQSTARVLRGVEELCRLHGLSFVRPQLLFLLRGVLPIGAECQQTLDCIRDLLVTPSGTVFALEGAAALERRLSVALGTPRRGDGMLALLDHEGNLDVGRLREQYDFQVALLASLDILEQQEGQLGIKAMSGFFCALPSFDDVHARLLKDDALRRKVAQGFIQLLLVPFGLPLRRLVVDAWTRCLLRNEHLLGQGGLNRARPVGLSGASHPPWDDRARLVYFPRRFADNHEGQTKTELLARYPADGWHVLLTEPFANLPQSGSGHALAGRAQLVTGRTPQDYLKSLPGEEQGWTLETYILAFLTHLERTGRVLDAKTGTLLIASYVPRSRTTLKAEWIRINHQEAHVSDVPVDGSSSSNGARAAVRVA